MFSASKRRSAAAAMLAFSIVVAGCAHRSPVPSEADRASMRSVGIACGTYVPEGKFNVPAKGRKQGALVGGAMGFAAPIQGAAAGGGNPYAVMIAAAIGVVMAPVGAAIGAGSAMSLEEARVSESELRKALAAMRIQESLCGRLFAEGGEKAAPRSFRSVEKGPAASSDNVAYGAKAREGFDTILEAQVARVGLSTMTWGSDPPMDLFLDVRLRLVRVKDDAELWTRKIWYRSPPRRFSEWAKDDGRLLRVEFEHAHEVVAAKAIEEVFFLVPLP